MKVICRHGFLSYYPRADTDLRRFQRIMDVTLVAENDYFTFEGLIGLPRYSLIGALFGTIPALATFEGRNAAEVMEENGFVYMLSTDLVVPKELVLSTMNLNLSQDYAVAASAFIQPGCFLQNGMRLLSYEGQIDLDTQRLKLYSWETGL